MGSTGSSSSTQTSQWTPPPWAAQAGQMAMQSAQSLAQMPFAVPAQPVAPLTPQQLQSFQEVENLQGAYNPFVNMGGQQQLAGSATALAGARAGTQQANNAVNNLNNNITQYYGAESAGVLPQLENIFGQQMAQTTGSGVTQAGGVGANRIGVTQAELANQQGLSAGQTLSQLMGQAVGQAQAGTGLELQGAQLTGQLAQNAGQIQQQGGNNLANIGNIGQTMGLNAANSNFMSGEYQQQQTQNEQNALYGQQLAAISWPFQTNQYLGSMAAGVTPSMGGTGLTSGNVKSSSMNSNALGKGAAGLGSMFMKGSSGGKVKGGNEKVNEILQTLLGDEKEPQKKAVGGPVPTTQPNNPMMTPMSVGMPPMTQPGGMTSPFAGGTMPFASGWRAPMMRADGGKADKSDADHKRETVERLRSELERFFRGGNAMQKGGSTPPPPTGINGFQQGVYLPAPNPAIPWANYQTPATQAWVYNPPDSSGTNNGGYNIPASNSWAIPPGQPGSITSGPTSSLNDAANIPPPAGAPTIDTNYPTYPSFNFVSGLPGLPGAMSPTPTFINPAQGSSGSSALNSLYNQQERLLSSLQTPFSSPFSSASMSALPTSTDILSQAAAAVPKAASSVSGKQGGGNVPSQPLGQPSAGLNNPALNNNPAISVAGMVAGTPVTMGPQNGVVPTSQIQGQPSPAMKWALSQSTPQPKQDQGSPGGGGGNKKDTTEKKPSGPSGPYGGTPTPWPPAPWTPTQETSSTPSSTPSTNDTNLLVQPMPGGGTGIPFMTGTGTPSTSPAGATPAAPSPTSMLIQDLGPMMAAGLDMSGMGGLGGFGGLGGMDMSGMDLMLSKRGGRIPGMQEGGDPFAGIDISGMDFGALKNGFQMPPNSADSIPPPTPVTAPSTQATQTQPPAPPTPVSAPAPPAPPPQNNAPESPATVPMATVGSAALPHSPTEGISNLFQYGIASNLYNQPNMAGQPPPPTGPFNNAMVQPAGPNGPMGGAPLQPAGPNGPLGGAPLQAAGLGGPYGGAPVQAPAPTGPFSSAATQPSRPPTGPFSPFGQSEAGTLPFAPRSSVPPPQQPAPFQMPESMVAQPATPFVNQQTIPALDSEGNVVHIPSDSVTPLSPHEKAERDAMNQIAATVGLPSLPPSDPRKAAAETAKNIASQNAATTAAQAQTGQSSEPAGVFRWRNMIKQYAGQPISNLTKDIPKLLPKLGTSQLQLENSPWGKTPVTVAMLTNPANASIVKEIADSVGLNVADLPAALKPPVTQSAPTASLQPPTAPATVPPAGQGQQPAPTTATPAAPLQVRPGAPIAPGAVTAVGGAPPAAFIVHHSGGSTMDSLVSTLKERGLGVQYAVDRDGTVYQIGGPGSSHMMNGSGIGNGLNNSNTVGVEFVAKDDSDVLPAQVAGFQKFFETNYPNTPIYGHGEVNPGHKEASEGMTTVHTIRDGQTFDQIFAGSPLQGKWPQVQAAAQSVGIPPDLLASIMAHETGHGRVTVGNNVAGLMTGPQAQVKKQFGSIDEGINAAANNVAKFYSQTGGDLNKLGEIWAPTKGATNDPEGKNKYWVSGVQSFRDKFGPQGAGVQVAGNQPANKNFDLKNIEYISTPEQIQRAIKRQNFPYGPPPGQNPTMHALGRFLTTLGTGDPSAFDHGRLTMYAANDAAANWQQKREFLYGNSSVGEGASNFMGEIDALRDGAKKINEAAEKEGLIGGPGGGGKGIGATPAGGIGTNAQQQQPPMTLQERELARNASMDQQEYNEAQRRIGIRGYSDSGFAMMERIQKRRADLAETMARTGLLERQGRFVGIQSMQTPRGLAWVDMLNPQNRGMIPWNQLGTGTQYQSPGTEGAPQGQLPVSVTPAPAPSVPVAAPSAAAPAANASASPNVGATSAWPETTISQTPIPSGTPGPQQPSQPPQGAAHVFDDAAFASRPVPINELMQGNNPNPAYRDPNMDNPLLAKQAIEGAVKRVQDEAPLADMQRRKLAAIDEMDHALSSMPAKGVLAAGSYIGPRSTMASSMRTLLDVAGIDSGPLKSAIDNIANPEATIAVEAVRKIRNELAKMTFDRGAQPGGGGGRSQYVAKTILNSIPTEEMQRAGASRILGAIKAGAQYDIDHYNAMAEWQRWHGTLTGFDEWWEQNRPVRQYTMAGQAAGAVDDDYQHIAPGTGDWLRRHKNDPNYNQVLQAYDRKYHTQGTGLFQYMAQPQ